METRFDEVAQVLLRYFDGLYESDAALLERVFHPDAIYACATESPFVQLSMAAYLPIVAARPSPASRGQARADEIVSVEFAGGNTAFAKVRCTIAPKRFTDFLTLVRTGGEWRIIAKVFHFELEL